MSKFLKLWTHRRFDSESAFEKAVEPHINSLYRLAWRWCGNPQDAEELLQDLLCKLYPKRREVLAVEQLHPWLTRVMYRLFVDHTRRKQARPSSISALEHGQAGDDPCAVLESGIADRPDAVTEQQLAQARLQAALNRLPEDQRILILMHDVEEYRLSELETILDAPLSTLKSRLHRGRERLRILLWDFDATDSPRPYVLSSEEANYEL
jgi:RNA polymerase sigma-70 factor (ECF subfamily)